MHKYEVLGFVLMAVGSLIMLGSAMLETMWTTGIIIGLAVLAVGIFVSALIEFRPQKSKKKGR